MSTNAQEVHPADTPRRPGEIRIGDVVRLRSGTTQRLVHNGFRDTSSGASTLYTVGENTRGNIVRATLCSQEVEIVQAASPGQILPDQYVAKHKSMKASQVAPAAPDPSLADDHIHGLRAE